MTVRDDSRHSPELNAAIEVARAQWPDARALERVRAGVHSAIAAQPSAGIGSAKLLRRSLRSSLWRGGTLLMVLAAGWFGLQVQREQARAAAVEDALPQALPALVVGAALPQAPAPQQAVLVPESEPSEAAAAPE